ncbi:alpha-2-macroglobulin family protein [Ensifer soli]|uniref:alpha-2-macroglobulin family protein n=1 Tax=Ciceribacter sp. sgz301302 TaxID=3342379 RepID=UPI0035BB98EB
MSMRLIRLVSLVALALLPVSAGAAETRREAVISENGDYFGFDLRTQQNLSLEECSAACVGNEACKAFTYNPKVRWCFLKSDFNQLNTFPGAVAGKIVTVEEEADIGAAPALPFVSAQWSDDARSLRSNLSVTDEQRSVGVENLRSLARGELAAGRIDNAITAFHAALAITPDDSRLWLETAQAGQRAGTGSDAASRSVLDALNAYQLTRGAKARAEALSVLGRSLDLAQNYRPGINAYKASLALSASPSVQTALDDLRERQGFRVTNNTLDSDSASPRACVEFSEPLVKTGVDYTPFVTLNGSVPGTVEAKGSSICVEGLSHGARYTLALRAGLPSSVDEPLAKPVEIEFYVKDRAPMVRFTGDSFVLPSTARRGIPIVSVNAASADLKLYRIGDRNLATLLSSSQFLTQLDGYNAGRLADDSGELVWQGAIDLSQDLNRDVVTSFPVDQALPQRKPGVYALTAVASGRQNDEWEARSTQWFVVSDLGLTTYAGTDGLTVFVRSLASAKPVEKAELQLLARNNEILGTATTDADGRAVFTAGLMRGTAGMAPAILTAKTGADDFVFLDMTRAGFDLSDRGVSGRAAPGAIDVFAWTERGIYRTGETVHVAALARDIESKAVENLPLTFVFHRPDSVEDRRVIAASSSVGGYAVELPLLANAMRGTWSVSIYADPKGDALAQKTFMVDDFVPDRIEFDLASAATAISVGTPAEVTIDGRFLYGAPAAGLAYEGEVRLKPTRESPAYKGFLFGLADEEASEDTILPLENLEPLDQDGKAAFTVDLTEVPSTTQLLNADVVVRLREGSGRAVERVLTLPVQPDGPMIGIKPEFSGDLSENSVARFQVIATDAQGGRQALAGLKWRLLAVERNYQWYRDGSAWRYEPVTNTRQVADGSLDVTADGSAIATPVGWGRYRLEVESPVIDGPQSSVEFDAGWYVAATSTETPDALEIALDKDRYAVGETAKLKVSPRFAGELLVAIGSESLIATQTATVPAGGGEINIPVTADWGAGTYVTATLFRPGDAQESRMPMRATGVKWLVVDPAERKLDVSLGVTDKMLPRQTLQIPVSVANAVAGETAYVMVAAVDVGILNMTRYEAPDPEGWYFGQRRLGLEIRDLYGRLIDGSLGTTGRLRTGGDGGENALSASPPREKLVAFFSGPVALDAAGKATIRFDIPQFNGKARVMAVAWSKTGVGHAVADVIIRDPVVVVATLPKVLAPQDRSQLHLDIANTDAPAGAYSLAVSGNASILPEGAEAARSIDLAEGAKVALTVPVIAGTPGDGVVTVRLSGNGLALEQQLIVPVRPAVLPVTTRIPVEIAAGNSLTVDGQLLADSILQGASVSLSVTRAAAFDIPALLMTLDRYPYGCAEQTTSRALPLLYLSELSAKSGLPEDGEVKKRVQEAIYRVLSYQSNSGSFGLWSPGYGDLWLDAYVTDFLTRAREKTYDVPEQAMVQALDNLRNSLAYDPSVQEKGNEIAYALYVLARNRKASIGDLRYYADTMINDFQTPLAKAHIAAALSLYGDAQRAETIFGMAARMSTGLVNVSLSRSDYGSTLRDDAAVLALAGESRPVPSIVSELSRTVAREWEAKRYTSTQEQTWMLMAARAVQGQDADLTLDVDGEATRGGLSRTLSGDALLAAPVTIRNTTDGPVSAVVTTVAAPVEPLSAGGDGFAITRTYYTLDGEEANVSEVRQNERYVAVLTVTEENDWPSRVLITDLLPAGFEIDNPSLVGSAELSNFDWIGDVEPAHTEFRNDRFVAAFDRSQGDNREITLAYVVRAVTPGTYAHPAASVEDMYRPQFSARTATGVMAVRAPE